MAFDPTSVIVEEENVETIEMGIDLSNPLIKKKVLDSLTSPYVDPLISSARETISNAYDAIIRAGSTKEIRITIPVAENGYLFSVEDKGSGLSYDEIQKNYVQYGNSDKSTDITQLGSYGYGAKSPLAYTKDSFDVITVKNGRKIHFRCVAGEYGNKTMFISDDETKEQNGTKVFYKIKDIDAARLIEFLVSYGKFDDGMKYIIDGYENMPSKDHILYDEITLNDDPLNRKSKIWINTKDFSQLLITEGFSAMKALQIKYVLSGYIYDSPHNSDNKWRNNGYYNYGSGVATKKDAIYVQLYPDMVDFPMSRDFITRGELSEKLHNKIIETLFNDYDEAVVKLLKAYKDNDVPTHCYVDYNVVCNGYNPKYSFYVDTRDNSENPTLYYYDDYAVKSEPFKVNLEDYTSSSGMNIMRYLSKNTKKTIFGGMKSLFEKNGKNFSSLISFDSNSKSYTIIGEKKSIENKYNVTVESYTGFDSKTVFNHRYFSEFFDIGYGNYEKVSVSNAVIGSLSNSETMYRYLNKKLEILILENFGEDEYKKFKKLRKFISDKVSTNTIILFSEGEVDLLEIEVLKEYFRNFKINVEEAGDYLSEKEEERKSLLNKNKTVDGTTLTGLFHAGFSKVSEVDRLSGDFIHNHIAVGNTLSKEITIDDVKAFNGIVLVLPRFSYYENVLVGMYNADENFVGENILALTENTCVKNAKILNELAEDDVIQKVFVSKDFKHKCKAMEKLSARVRHGSKMKPNWSQYSDDEILYSAIEFVSSNIFNNFDRKRKCLKSLKQAKEFISDTTYGKVIEFIEQCVEQIDKVSSKYKDASYRTIAAEKDFKDVFNARFPEMSLMKLKGFAESLKFLTGGYSTLMVYTENKDGYLDKISLLKHVFNTDYVDDDLNHIKNIALQWIQPIVDYIVEENEGILVNW